MASEFDDEKVVRLPRGRTEPEPEARRRALQREVDEILQKALPEEAGSEPIAPPNHPIQQWLPPAVTTPAPQVDVPRPVHRNAVECPQCDRWTWKATYECRHCGYNLHDHYLAEEQARQERIEHRIRLERIASRRRCQFWILGLLIAGVILLGQSSKLPEALRGTAFICGMIAILLAVVLQRWHLPRL